ncbi:MAG: GNAT family N-acetyltransferase [Caldilineaceae bacterium]|nr:GNAT family N-acetyltransferase [Caldilineaceae bacterium]
MIPIVPDIAVRQLQLDDAEALLPLVNELLALAPFSRPMSVADVRTEILEPQPPTVMTVRWQDNACFGAWRGGALIGALDAAVGFDAATLELPEYRPLGLLRFLALPARADLVDTVMDQLLAAAVAYWRRQRVVDLRAFRLSTGYPSLQAGVGVLPGDWGEQFRQLTRCGFQLDERYFCLHRPVERPVEEYVSLAELSLVHRGRVDDRVFEIYRRAERLARARLVRTTSMQDDRLQPVGLIADLHVEPNWRRHGLGRWLLARMINEATSQGLRELAAFVTMQHYAAMSLLSQYGFEELHYRGYTLESALKS